MAGSIVRSLTPVLIVDAIEPCLPFWTERLGFEVTVTVPHEGTIGFAILARDGVELMYQTTRSVEADVPGANRTGTTQSCALYLHVNDLDTTVRALEGAEITVPRRKTFYGADEIGAREPGGHVVIFARQGA